MSYESFLCVDVDSFNQIVKYHAEHEEAKRREEWERMRILATITISPHVDRKQKMTPEKILPFHWDKEKPEQHTARTMTVAEQRERMKQIAEQFGETMI